MKLVATFHQPSSVLSSLKCQLSSRDLEHLVVAKLNRIDVYSLQQHGLKHECGVEIWGKVLSVKPVPIPGSTRSNLVLMIAHPDPELIFLSYSESEAGTGDLTVRNQLALYERTPRPAEFFNDILIHPSGKLAVVSCYTGKLKIITFKAGNYQGSFDASLPELNVFGLAFLSVPEDEYTLAILHIDHMARVRLLARDVLVDDMELSSYPSPVLHPTPVSSQVLPYPTESIPHLIPVPPQAQQDDIDEDGDEKFAGGVLIVGGRKVLLFELANKEGQEKQKGKRRRLEARKKGKDLDEAGRASEKEREREARKREPIGSVDWPWGEVTAWCTIDQNSLRYFIGDSYGNLSMLSVDYLKTNGLILLPLGETSSPTTLTYLTTQTLYLGSHVGDSQLLQISTSPTSSLTSPTLHIPSEVKTIPAARLGLPSTRKGKERATDDDNNDTRDISKGCVVESMGSFIKVLDTFKNIAPIMDAVLVDTDGSGQRQIVTCSGGANTGSVNVVRNGADFQELAFIAGLTDVTNIWAVRDMFEDTTDSFILVSTLHQSLLFKINDAGSTTTLSHVEVAPVNALITTAPTLAFGNVAQRVVGTGGKSRYINSQFVVQVVPKGAFLLEFDMMMGMYVRRAGWDAYGPEIVAGSINPSQVVLALKGGWLVALTITENNEFRVVVESSKGITLPEISTVSCAPLDPSKFFSNYATVSYWGSNIIEIFSLSPAGFASVAKSPPLQALIRSAVLFNFGSDDNPKGEDYHPHLIAGLGDGSLVYFPWKDKQLQDKKITSLGHAPVSLTVCHVDGKRTLFAAGNRAMVLSWEKKRLHSSPIMLKEVAGASRLNTASFASSLILATPTGLFIGRVRDLDKMHIRSIPLGLDNPRKLAYQPDLKVFGVACTRADPGRIGDPESFRSSFRLLDDTTFSNLSQFNCEADEEITVVMALSPMVNGAPMPLFCLGVYTYEADEKEPTKGKLMIFTAHYSETRAKSGNVQLSLVTTAHVNGCVYALAPVGNMIVASVNSSVKLYCLVASDDVPSPSFTLQLLSEWNHNYLVMSLASYGDVVVAGDQISSVSLLKVSNSKVQNVARDYGPLWPVCVEASDEENIIGANDALNLFTFTLTRTLGRAVLERNGYYHLADLVTKFIRGSLTSTNVPSSNAALEPKHMFFTSSGRIGVVVDVTDEQLSLHLTALQNNLADITKGVGGIAHPRFRAPKSTRGHSDADDASFGFIDGDLLEQFLTHLGSPQQIEKIVQGRSEPTRLTIPVDELQKVLEDLQSMH